MKNVGINLFRFLDLFVHHMLYTCDFQEINTKDGAERLWPPDYNGQEYINLEQCLNVGMMQC